MIRLPFFPTLIVAAAVAVMIGLGIWQLDRADEKERLLAEYARAATLPPVDLDPLIERGTTATVPLAFRRALVTCRSEGAPQVRAGHNREGVTGYSYFLPCRPGSTGFASRLLVNTGWSQRPDAVQRVSLGGVVAGTFGAAGEEGPVTLTSAAALPPLHPSAPPSMTDIPNNHISYAWQWFFFAAAAVVIYLLALRRRERPAP